MAGACHHGTKAVQEFHRRPTQSQLQGHPRPIQGEKEMPAKIIVSYDGTANEDDAIALGRLLGKAGAQVSLAYVSHTDDSAGDNQGVLDRGLQLLGDPN